MFVAVHRVPPGACTGYGRHSTVAMVVTSKKKNCPRIKDHRNNSLKGGSGKTGDASTYHAQVCCQAYALPFTIATPLCHDLKTEEELVDGTAQA